MEELNPHYQRAWMLLQRANYELAEQELRQALLAEPDSAWPHAMLALCLTHRDRHQEANDEVETAIGLAPDDSFAHYVRSIVLINANCFPEAEQAIRKALELDSDAPHLYAQWSLTLFHQKRWADALAAAEQGLQLDPEHEGCVNLRTMSLVKLGRRDAAAESLQGALERDPDDAWTHSNLGWTLLEQRKYAQALEHFREALRLEPQLESARDGIVTAMKARNILYRPVLAYFLWVQKLSSKYSWGLFLGLYLCFRFLNRLGRDHPEWGAWITPILILYVAFALTTWLADPLFNLVLRTSRFGRLALDDEERKTSTLVGVCVLIALTCVALYFALQEPLLLYSALLWMIAVLPLSLMYKAEAGWPRLAVLGMAVVLMLMGVSPLAIRLLHNVLPEPLLVIFGQLTVVGLRFFPIAAIGSQILSQLIVQRAPRRVVLRRI